MMHPNQMIVPILALAGTVLYLLPFIRSRVRKIPHHRLLAASFFLMAAGWTSNIPATVFHSELFTIFTHLGFCLSALVFMGWARLLQPGKGPPSP